jgi:hypothetical protein
VFDLKDIYKTCDIENNNNINTLIEKQNDNLFNKINLLICNDITCELKKDLNNSFEQLYKSNSKITFDDVQNIISDKYDRLYNIFNTNFLHLKEIGVKNTTINENTNTEIVKLLNRYNNSSSKGDIGEFQLNKLLLHSFPSAEIINTSNLTGKGDFMLERQNKDILLIETKEYTNNVKKSEIDKFIKDCTNNNCNGLFLSQTSGIVNKSNFQIDIHNNKILIYIHNMNYDKDKLLLGVNLIDMIYEKLNLFNGTTININSDELKNINNEFQQLIYIKNKMIIDLKDYYKKTFDNINKINMLELENILTKHFANLKKNNYICEICNTYEALSLKSLARHKTICKKKHDCK